MQQRRGTAAQWTSANPTLAAGEIGYETDTGKFKIGNGSSQWSALNYYVDANAILDGAPGVLDTLNELAAALGDDPAFITTVATNLSNHESDTTNVHGIANTANLATLDDVADAVSNATVDQSTLAGEGIDWNAGTSQFDIDNTVVTLTGTQTLTNKTLTGANLGSSSVAVTQSGTDNTTKLATTEFVQGRINAVVAGSPELLNTLNELSAAIANDENFAATISGQLGEKISKSGDTMTGYLALNGIPSNDDHAATKKYVDDTSESAADGAVGAHNALTTNIHGIDDVGELATKTYANDAVSDHNSATNVHGIADTTALALTADIEAHRLDTTSVHGIANTADLVLTNDSRLSDTRTPTDNTVTTAKIVNSNVTADKLAGDSVTTAKILDGAVTSAKIADGTIVNADINASAAIDWTKLAVSSTVSATELGYVDGVTSAIQTQLDSKLASTTAASTYAPIASPTFTGTVSGVTKSMVGLGNVNNTSDADKPVSTATQTALDAKANLASPTFTGTVSGITKSMVGLANVDNTSDANKPVSTATQTALDAKANLASPTFTGTVSGITKSMVGLGNVDNTADSAKPVSTATQTALDAKLSLAGGTMTGALTLSGAPTADSHAATKAYVDGVTSNINFHQPVRVATTGNITLSGTQTIDGVALSVGDRVLVKDQSNQKNNGIYEVKNNGWTRTADADNTPDGELKGGDFTLVLEGTVNSGYGYVCSNTSAITIGTTDITYAAFNAAKAVSAGTGLQEATPGTLSIDTATTVDISTAQTLSNKTFSAPVLGAATATSINSTTIPTNKTLVVTTDKLSVHAATTSAELAGVISDETGSGALVFATSPTLVTPTLGVATATSINGTSIPSSKTLVTTADSGTVTSTMIADGTIVDADINASAAIAQSKISGLTSDLAAKAPLASPTFTGTVTVSASGVAFTDGTQTKQGVPSQTTINSISANYNLSTGGLTLRDTMVESTAGSGITVTIPTNATTAYPVGTTIDFLQTGAGQITFAGASGVTLNGTPGLKTRTQWSSASLFKRATDTWVVLGDLSA